MPWTYKIKLKSHCYVIVFFFCNGGKSNQALVRRPPEVYTTLWALFHLRSSPIKWMISYKSWCTRTTSTTKLLYRCTTYCSTIITAEKSELHPPSPSCRNAPNSSAYNGHSYLSRRRSFTGHFKESNGALEQRARHSTGVLQYY